MSVQDDRTDNITTVSNSSLSNHAENRNPQPRFWVFKYRKPGFDKETRGYKP